MKLRSLTILIITILCIENVVSQDIQLSQFHVADLLLNPALTGRKHRNRFMFHQRWQWPKLQGKYNSTLLSYDTYVQKYNSGFGAYITNDSQGGGIIKTTKFSLLYSYELPISQTLTLRFGLEGGAYNRRLNDDGLVYSDQVTSSGIDPNGSSEVLTNTNYWQPDIGVGIIMYAPKLWFGYSAYHINAPQQLMLGDNPTLPISHDLKVGYKFSLAKANPQSYIGSVKEFVIFPIIHYKVQGENDQIELGANMIDDQLLVGLWYRGIPFKKYQSHLHNNEAIILVAGWKLRQVEFSYSYDIVLSKLTPAKTGGAHEINISYVFPKHLRIKKYRALPCPDFQRID